ncbi:MAG: porin family protein, partial [Lentisphaeria bacterium]|nr:porin family protein [Lentisphaeria bacterium]
MKKSLVNLSMLMFLCTASVAVADNTGKMYFGAQYAISYFDESGLDEFNPTLFVARFGKYINDSVAIEARIGVGLEDDTVDISTIDYTLELDTLYGLYAVVNFPLGDALSAYGLIGFTEADATFSASGLSGSADDDGLSYGVGLNWGSDVALNLEYMEY